MCGICHIAHAQLIFTGPYNERTIQWTMGLVSITHTHTHMQHIHIQLQWNHGMSIEKRQPFYFHFLLYRLIEPTQQGLTTTPSINLQTKRNSQCPWFTSGFLFLTNVFQDNRNVMPTDMLSITFMM